MLEAVQSTAPELMVPLEIAVAFGHRCIPTCGIFSMFSIVEPCTGRGRLRVSGPSVRDRKDERGDLANVDCRDSLLLAIIRPAGKPMTTCPECEVEMDVDEFDVDRGDQLSCPECGANLAVLRVAPVELDLVSEDEAEDVEGGDAGPGLISLDEDKDKDED